MVNTQTKSIGDLVRNLVVKPTVFALALATSTGYAEAQSKVQPKPDVKTTAPKFEKARELCTIGGGVGTSDRRHITQIEVYDINGDGKPDIVVGTNDGNVYVCLNNTDYSPKK